MKKHLIKTKGLCNVCDKSFSEFMNLYPNNVVKTYKDFYQFVDSDNYSIENIRNLWYDFSNKKQVDGVLFVQCDEYFVCMSCLLTFLNSPSLKILSEKT
jgi:protein-arginine kinase activator protein McsA